MYVYLFKMKMKTVSILFVMLFMLVSGMTMAQVSRSSTDQFMLKGQVINAEDDSPVARVNIEIDGGGYATTNRAGEFVIAAKLKDQLTIKSEDFQTVYITVLSRERITVKVQKPAAQSLANSTGFVTKKKSRDVFIMYIDSAKTFLRKDAKRSIQFVTQALESMAAEGASAAQNSSAFEVLGDINSYWQQHDLAVENYKRSIQAVNKVDVAIKLAAAYRENGSHQESIQVYNTLISGNKLTNYQEVEVYEGLGDTYNAIDDPVKSVENYEKGLSIAETRKIVPKITDLNSKIGTAYAQGGAIEEAEDYFGNSLDLATKENQRRAVTEKNKVADFYSTSQNFDKEIELRQGVLDELEALEDDTETKEDEDNPLTPQRQNYKIANAYLAQDKYEEAIPYLEKSIEEADKVEDLTVQKDATRKLSELYRDIGDFDKASESYQNYVEVFDQLYIKKEQEISQAARFSKEIALTQSRIAGLENEKELNQSRYLLAFENQELIEKNVRVQKWIIGSLVLIALLLMFTAFSQFRGMKQQRFANDLLALKSLRTQMNPHFIFNALNSVNSFIASNDERAANRYLSEFSQLMRSVLENSEEDFIPLAKELELLTLYVKLEHFRFKDKFDYNVIVDEQLKLDDFIIPPMLLQPYVENAVWHGLRYKEERGLLEISFRQVDNETVVITIEDDGIGRKKSKLLKTENQKKQNSKGMGNIQKRISILNTMYKDKVDVNVENIFESEEGTRVTLTLKKD